MVEKSKGISESVLGKEVVVSSPSEKLAAFHACYHYLIIETRNEIFHDLRKEGIDENNVLRGIVKNLAVSLGKDKRLIPEEWLCVGIIDFIPDNKLKEWAYPTVKPNPTETYFHLTAKYFLEKKQASDKK
jgi:hypothetical protein